jgi:hypothetical protein
VAGLSLFALPASAAEAPELDARLACEPAPGPGRVRCSLAASVGPELRLGWVDALVLEAPPFARPLRSRIPYRGSLKEPKAELLLGLMARSTGRGRLAVRVRALVCPRQGVAGRCRPLTRDAEYELIVGSS